MKDCKSTFENITFVIYLTFSIIFIVLLSIMIYNVYSCSDLEIKDYIIALVTIITSIVIGSFFLVRVYVENQLGIKEKNMIAEYEKNLKDALDKQSQQQSQQIQQQSQQIQQQSQQIQQILDWINSQPKK